MKPVNYFPSLTVGPNVGTALLLAAGLLASSPSAAAFTILDGDPADPQTFRVSGVRGGDSGSAAGIPFVEGRATLGPRGRRAVLELVPKAVAADRVTIVARADGSDSESLRTQRANAIRQLLVANKVPAARISVEHGTVGVPDSEPRVYMSDIRIQSPAAITAPVYAVAATATVAPVATASVEARPIPAAVKPLPPDIQQQIIELYKTGALSSDDLGRLLSPAMINRETVLTTQGAADDLSPVRTWKLPAGGTLRDALIAWSRTAGWNPPVWHPDDPGEITETVAIRTDLLTMLAEVAAAAPSYDIHVSRQRKQITVHEKSIAVE